MVTSVDASVKNVTEALKRSGLYEDTLIVWTTDNGAPYFPSTNKACVWIESVSVIFVLCFQGWVYPLLRSPRMRASFRYGRDTSL